MLNRIFYLIKFMVIGLVNRCYRGLFVRIYYICYMELVIIMVFI